MLETNFAYRSVSQQFDSPQSRSCNVRTRGRTHTGKRFIVSSRWMSEWWNVKGAVAADNSRIIRLITIPRWRLPHHGCCWNSRSECFIHLRKFLNSILFCRMKQWKAMTMENCRPFLTDRTWSHFEERSLYFDIREFVLFFWRWFWMGKILLFSKIVKV